ncbi:MAG: hypothetical protein KAJ66_02580 [Candidatus Omnitrophica bacterium]|nr:hypothetical protein [Candidatus Omnitrophota bacterium]
MSRDVCSVCGKTKASIGEKIRAMQNQGVVVISHDLIAFCEKCDVSFCSDHYDLDDMEGTHKCSKCGSALKVERTGY